MITKSLSRMGCVHTKKLLQIWDWKHVQPHSKLLGFDLAFLTLKAQGFDIRRWLR